ncbi:MAG: M23 family metallopeptidase, partial [Elusimicrobiota bacterium]
YSLHKAGQTAAHAVTLAGGAALGLSGLGVAIPFVAPVAVAIGAPLALGAGAYSLTSASVSVARYAGKDKANAKRKQEEHVVKVKKQYTDLQNSYLKLSAEYDQEADPTLLIASAKLDKLTPKDIEALADRLKPLHQELKLRPQVLDVAHQVATEHSDLYGNDPTDEFIKGLSPLARQGKSHKAMREHLDDYTVRARLEKAKSATKSFEVKEAPKEAVVVIVENNKNLTRIEQEKKGRPFRNIRNIPQKLLPVIPEEALLVYQQGDSKAALPKGWQHNGKVVLRVITQSGEARINSDGSPRTHAHVDFGVPKGTPVRAWQQGVVVKVDYLQESEGGGPGPGHRVTLLHEDENFYYFSQYLHNYSDDDKDPIKLRSGDHVLAGQEIAKSGDSGGVPPHLDFGLYKVPKKARENIKFGVENDEYTEKTFIEDIKEFKENGKVEDGNSILSNLKILTRTIKRGKIEYSMPFYVVNPLNPANWPTGSN